MLKRKLMNWCLCYLTNNNINHQVVVNHFHKLIVLLFLSKLFFIELMLFLVL